MADFDGCCPWCGRNIERDLGWNGADCPCGAIVRYARPQDFDEVIDPAIFHFKLTPDAATVNFGHPRSWLESFGVDFRFGGEGPDDRLGRFQYFWFKRVRETSPSPEERMRQLEASANEALQELGMAGVAEAGIFFYPVARDALRKAAEIARGLGRADEAARLEKRLAVEIPASYRV